MNIELDEVVMMDVSDEALEMAAGGAQGGCGLTVDTKGCWTMGCPAEPGGGCFG
jgi:hypothetical protein